MTGPQPTPQARVPSQANRKPPRRTSRKKIIGAVVIGVILLGAGFAAGAGSGQSAIPGYKHQVAQARRNLAAEKVKLAAEKSKLSAEQGQVQSAQSAATHALAIAQATVSKQYAARLAAVKQQHRTLAREERSVRAEKGQIQASAISADGVYVAGSDITQGIWHTAGDHGVGGQQCYFAKLSSDNTSDIIDNNNFDGPETVDLSGAHAFDISGGCTWVKVG